MYALKTNVLPEQVVWGQNKHGQCGVRIPGEEEALQRPLFVPGLLTHRVVSAACGGGHTLVGTDSGKVLSWGTGQLGQRVPELETPIIPVQTQISCVATLYSAARDPKSDGTRATFFGEPARACRSV